MRDAYEVSAKLMMALKGMTPIAKFYNNVGHPQDPDNISWPIIKWFGAVEGSDGNNEG